MLEMRGAVVRGVAFGVVGESRRVLLCDVAPWYAALNSAWWESHGASCSKGFLQKCGILVYARRKPSGGINLSCKKRGIEIYAEELLAKSGNF